MFVRLISSLDMLSKICDETDMTPLGYVYTDLRTKDNTLSMWQIESMDDFNDAALSIVLPRDKVADATFIIIDEKILDEFGIEYSANPPKEYHVLNSKAVHFDMTNVLVKNIDKVLSVYQRVYHEELSKNAENEKNIIKWTTPITMQYLSDAISDGKIDNSYIKSKTTIMQYYRKSVCSSKQPTIINGDE